jgi:DNA mismatch repair ATPase MutS
MKRVVEERGSLITLDRIRAVNIPNELGTSPMGGSCQERVDTKAFTGRGTHRELRQLEAEVDRLDRLMRDLSASSKQVTGAEIYLMLHQRHSTGYQFLRWRENGRDKRHLSWDEGEAIWSRYTASLREWYAQVAHQAQMANELHLKRRREIKSARYQINKREHHVFARPIPG